MDDKDAEWFKIYIIITSLMMQDRLRWDRL